MLPGGGVEENETPGQAMKREIREELGVDVSEVKLISDLPSEGYDIYRRYMTYLIKIDLEKLKIGSESVSHRKIVSHDWIPLFDESKWHEGVLTGQIQPSLKNLQTIIKV